jgi:hypothetical protein
VKEGFKQVMPQIGGVCMLKIYSERKNHEKNRHAKKTEIA